MVKEKKTLEEKVTELTSMLGDEEERAKQLAKTKNKYESIIAALEEQLKKEQEVRNFKRRTRIYVVLYYKLLISKALSYGPHVTRVSHSFSCHPQTNHTCLYSPAARHYRLLVGTHCAYPRRDGQAELTWVAGHILR